MYDSYKPAGYEQISDSSSPAEEAVSFDIRYETYEKDGILYIDVIPSRAWLEDSKRVYPVTIDPTIVKYQPTYALADTNIRSVSPNTTGPTETTLGVGLYKDSTQTNVIRSLLRFDTSSIPVGAKVLNANLNMWLSSVSNTTSIDVTLHEVTTAWTEYSASWNYADASNLWINKGGDFLSSQISTVAGISSLTSLDINYRWPIAPYIIDKWINDGTRNKGLLLKSTAETTNSYKKFISGDDTANPSNSPLLSVTYYPASRLGLESYWTFDSHPLVGGAGFTNLGTGNNILQFTDYSLEGRGNFGIDFTRTYNSKSVEQTPLGYGWSYTGSESIIENRHTGEVLFTDSDGTSHSFVYTASTGAYQSPAGKYLTLTKVRNTSGVTTGYRITDKHGIVTHFDVTSHDEIANVIRAKIGYEADRHGNKVSYLYDTNGRLNSISDPSGRSITFAYEASGRVDYALLEGRKMDYGYDAAGKLVTVDQYKEDGSYSRSQFLYNTDNRINVVIDPNGRRTDYTYNQDVLEKVQEPQNSPTGNDLATRPGITYSNNLSARKTTVIDAELNKSSYEMNENYVITRMVRILSDGTESATVYNLDANYNPLEVTDPAGGIAYRTFDAKGNLLTFKDEEGNLSSHTYDSFSNMLTETDAKNNVTSYSYNSVGDLEVMTDPKGQIIQYAYDAYGNLKTVTHPNGTIESYEYDASGNDIRTVRDTSGNTVSTITDSMGNVTSETNGRGFTTGFNYDLLNQLRTVTDPKNFVTRYNYDKSGNIKTVTNARNFITSYEYNGMNQVTKEISPLNKITENQYDANGNLRVTKTANGDTLSFDYNDLEQLTTMSVNSTLQWTYQYDENGNLKDVLQKGLPLRHFEYYKNGHLKQETDRGNLKDYQYYPNDLLKQLKHTVGTSSVYWDYDYTTTNQLKHIKRNGVELINYQYDAKMDDLDIATRQNGTYTDVDYDAGNRLKKYANYLPGGSLLNSFTYEYEQNGNIKSVLSSSGTFTFDYDQLDQLEKETLPGGGSISYSYDGAGNRLSKTVTSSTIATTSYSYNGANQIEVVNGVAYTYDANGNLRNDGSRTYVYNELDQLSEIRSASGQSIFKAAYDERGRRVQTETADGIVNYFYEGDQVIYETNGSNQIIVEYTWDDDGNPVSMIKNGQTYFYHLNGQGDVVGLTNSSGAAVASYSYDAWGNILAQSGVMADSNPYRYKGYRYDGHTKLYYLMARYYNPVHGNFLSEDPQSGLSEEPLSQNDYAYALNNPVNIIDPSGEHPILVIVAFILVRQGIKYVLKKQVNKQLLKATVKASKGTGKGLEFSSKQSLEQWTKQYSKRGWDEKLIQNTTKKPYTTREGFNKHSGNKTTVYYNKDGSHVIVDKGTKKIIQISDRTKPWKPDSSIKNPYKP